MPRSRLAAGPACSVVLLFSVTLLQGLVVTSSWRATGSQSGEQLGYSVSTGDLNGDGYSDVIVGEPRFSNGTSSEGRVRVYHGSAAGLPTAPSWIRESDLPATSPEFGRSVAGAGDVDGDGYDDLIVGAPVGNGRGEAYLFSGSPFGVQGDPVWIGFLGQNSTRFGSSVAGAGDVNGDGFGDVIVGAPNFSNSVARGAALVYHGSPLGPSTTPDWSVYGPQSYYSGLGATVSPAGDVNGDGYDDVILGADQFTNGQTNEGGAFVYLGSPSGLAATPSWGVESNRAQERFGLAVAGGGDVNGDGYSDVVVAGPLFDGTLENEGVVRVYHGSALGPGAVPAFTVTGGYFNILFGQAVDNRNDLNGDGYDDLVVGAIWQQGENQSAPGAARVYYGSPAGLTAAGSETVMGPRDQAEFGHSVNLAGDVDADGFADLIVGAPIYHDDSAGLASAGLAQANPGSGSALDRDGDGRTPAGGDCNDRNAQVWARPQEVANLGFLDGVTLAWDGQTSPDGQPIRFDVMRSGSPGDFVSSMACVQSDVAATQIMDPLTGPAPGSVVYYLVRAENLCPGVTGRGPLGSNSAGVPRSAAGCP